MVVSLEVAVVDPGLLQISGEMGLPSATVLIPQNRASETTADHNNLIRFFLRQTRTKLTRDGLIPQVLDNLYWNIYQ